MQGIARDINNTARANEDINLTFSIYYKVLDVAQTPIVNYTQLLRTDAFGIFSHVINNPYTNNYLFEKYQMCLKISSKVATGIYLLQVKMKQSTLISKIIEK